MGLSTNFESFLYETDEHLDKDLFINDLIRYVSWVAVVVVVVVGVGLGVVICRETSDMI